MVPKQLSPTVVLNKATQGTRLANYLIDAVVFYILIFFLGVFLGILSAIGIEAPLRFFMYLDEIPYISFTYSLLNILQKVKASENLSPKPKLFLSMGQCPHRKIF